MTKHLLRIFLLIISMIYSCSPATEDKPAEVKTVEIISERITDSEVKDLIQRYDKLLSRAYITMDLKDLNELITPDHLSRLEHRLSNIEKADRQMLAELKDIEFAEIKYLDESPIFVKTKEVWDIRHIDLKTQEVVKEHKDYTYELAYEIVRQKNKWLINSGEVINEKASR